MAGKIQNFIDHGDCIPEEMMRSYLDGNLSEKQSHDVEKHLLECEMCSDALEGLRMMDPVRSKAIVTELNDKIDERISGGASGGKVIQFRSTYKIAAVIALFILFGGGYFFLKNKVEKKTLSENALPPLAATDSAPAQFEPQNAAVSTVDTVIPRPDFSSKIIEEKTKSIAKKEDKESIAESVTSDVSKTTNDVTTSKDEGIKTENEVTMSATTKRGADVWTNDLPSSKATPAAAESKETSSNTQMSDKNLMNSRVIYQAADTRKLYLQAKTNYDAKKYEEAANDFEKLINDTTSSFYDDSKWFLANCYIKIHKNAKSRKLLKEIAASESPHKMQAQGLLQELQ